MEIKSKKTNDGEMLKQRSKVNAIGFIGTADCEGGMLEHRLAYMDDKAGSALHCDRLVRVRLKG